MADPGQLGRFKILSRLGEGGMAEVFLASESSPEGIERLVVIKRVLPAVARDQMFVSMFLDEAALSARLNHPNIAHVYEAGQHEGDFYLAMEFVHGADLRNVLRCRAHRLGPALSALIAVRVAAALHHAHQLTDLHGQPLHVVHRDISPSNICISHEGVVKVVDFGIAKASTNKGVTRVGVLKGKYPYMSPEQTTGQPIDARSDVFALGVVLHEMLTYRTLFLRETDFKTVEAIISEPIPTPTEVGGPEVPQQLERIVMRALARPREERYGSAREMQRELEAYLHVAPATDADLEEFMVRLFGDAETRRQKLLRAVQSADQAEIRTHASVEVASTVAERPGARRAERRGGPARSVALSRALVLVTLLIVITLVAGGLLLWRRGTPPDDPGTARAPDAAPRVLQAPVPGDAGTRADSRRTCTVTILSWPAAAEVVEGGRRLGVTPLVKRAITCGEKHLYMLRKEGWQPVLVVVEAASAGHSFVSRRLQPRGSGDVIDPFK